MAGPNLAEIPSFFALMGIGFVLYYITNSFVVWARFRHFPGPLSAKFSHFLMAKFCLSGKSYEKYTALNRQYGPLVQMAPGTLITDDVGIIRRMSAARSEYGRSNWYRAMKLDPTGDSMFSMMDDAVHDKLKAKCANAYGGKENPTLESDLDETIAIWIDLIRRKYVSMDGEFKQLDFARSAQFFALDYLTKISCMYSKHVAFPTALPTLHPRPPCFLKNGMRVKR
jgi:hypothetical protein